MNEFRAVVGFEDLWRALFLPGLRTPKAILSAARPSRSGDFRALLWRIVAREPEVVVKVAGRTHTPRLLRAHLEYISRKGELELEDRDGFRLQGRGEVKELAQAWSAMALADSRRRANTPISLSIVLSMPKLADPAALRDAARALARERFDGRHDYVFALHTDVAHPHVHLAVRVLGDGGQRLRLTKADLQAWREGFARALRERGVGAEATPRWARGVTRKSERTVLRKIREHYEAGRGQPARVHLAAYREAARAAFLGETTRTPWEEWLVERQAKVRAFYLAQAELLGRSPDPEDRALGQKVEAFVRSMPRADSQRLALARELRAVNDALSRERSAAEKDRCR